MTINSTFIKTVINIALKDLFSKKKAADIYRQQELVLFLPIYIEGMISIGSLD
ncbi:hypothetical protein [Thalassobacillus devorans]|uniref:hypothetical protein n=1 Tax=Thalassobacillus devorans TaxID=279813 RepID=UPI00166F5625|nr:hypothetical protein [Thalassobacillus devorans]